MQPFDDTEVYRTPPLVQGWRWFVRSLYASVFAAFVPALLWGIGSNVFARGNSSAAWSYFCLFLSPTLFLAVLWRLWRTQHFRLALHDDHMLFGGRRWGRLVRYDEVFLIQLVRPDDVAGPVQKLIVRTLSGKQIVWVRTAEAEECLHRLRQLCPRSSAIGPDDEVYESTDPAFEGESNQHLTWAFRRRARVSLVTGVYCSALLAAGTVAMAGGWLSGVGRVKLWITLVVLFAGAIGGFVGGLVYGRRARTFEARGCGLGEPDGNHAGTMPIDW